MNERIYLDYCATTPLHPEVLAAMKLPLEHQFGNPSSLHQEGRQAAEMLAAARSQVAHAIGAKPDEIIFTSGATEANNLALRGVLSANPQDRRHLITSAIEHHAVLHTAEKLEDEGFQLTILPVETSGQVDPNQLRSALRRETALVSIMMVNNEMGAIQPIAELCKITKAHGALFHTDAVQAMGTLSVEVNQLGIDLLSLSGHKIYGPKGVGALFVREGTALEAVLMGGPQEQQMRAGTENLPGVVGLGAAVEIVCREKESERTRLASLRGVFIEQLGRRIPDAIVHGETIHQAAHILSIAFPGTDAEMLLFRLDQAGIAASMGSACNADSIEPSHVLLAMGLPTETIATTLRFSLGMGTTERQIEQLLEVLPDLVEQCRDD